MFINYFNTYLLTLLLLDSIERKYPKEYKEFTLRLAYNIFYYCSKLEITFIKIYNRFNQYVACDEFILKLKKYSKENNIINSQTKCQEKVFIKNNIAQEISSDYDFIIYSDANSEYINKKIYHKEQTDIITFEQSNIKFLLIECQMANEEYKKIELNNDLFNYYIVGNKFTKYFFMYYFKYHLKLEVKYDSNIQCRLRIIDHDVNKLELDLTDESESILLEKHGYRLEIINH